MLIVNIFNLLSLIQLIVICMQGSATETDQVVDHTVTYIMNNLNYEIFAKETLKKMPEHTFYAINRLKENIIFVENLPKPIYKRQMIMQEDQMPYSPPKEKLLPCSIPLRRFSQFQLKTPSTGNLSRRRNMSRYAPTADKKQFINQIHLDLSQVKQNKVIEIFNRSQQNTAITFRSAIELDSQIAEMRKTYLKNLKNKAQFNKTQSNLEFPSKKKRIPKQFTFGFSGELIQKRNLAAKGIVFSPLKTKSVGIQKIHKKVQESRNNSQEESNNLQEILERAKTGSAEKKKREYNNLSRRQVSHIPFINLMQNTKLYQNDAKIEGQSKNLVKDSTFYSSRKSSFIQYRQENKEKDDLNLNMTQYTFPKSYKPLTKQKIGQGKITKSKALDGQIYNQEFDQDEPQNHYEKQIVNKKF